MPELLVPELLVPELDGEPELDGDPELDGEPELDGDPELVPELDGPKPELLVPPNPDELVPTPVPDPLGLFSPPEHAPRIATHDASKDREAQEPTRTIIISHTSIGVLA
jgi:hypothetical protein